MTSTSPGSGASMIERLGWRAERRPEPGFAHVLAAGAGAFAVFAMVALVIEIADEDPTLPGVLGSLALLVVAAVVGLRRDPGPIRSACATVVVLCVPLLWGFLMVGDGETGESGLRGVYILSALTYIGFYFVSWTRGRAILIGLALLLTFTWITSEVQGDASGVPFQTTFESQTDIDTSDTPFPGDEDLSDFEDDGDNTTETSATAFVLGLVALAAGWRLDRERRAGIATPFIAVGALFAIVGATALGLEESVVAGGLMAALAGAITGLVGGLGEHRRGSTWIGVLAVVGGLLAVIADIADDGALEFAALSALVAIGLGAIAFTLAPRLDESPDGDDEGATPPPTAPRTGGTTTTPRKEATG